LEKLPELGWRRRYERHSVLVFAKQLAPVCRCAEARLSVFKYIETFHNPVRLHQTLGYLSPNQCEADNAPAVAA